MATVRRNSVVPHSAAEMFALVDDIDSYPEFLPWCRSTRVLSRNPDEVRASIEIARGGIHKSFTTRNLLQKNKMIEIRLLDGPFKRMDGYWLFETLPNGSRVSLDLDFEFSSRLLQMAVGPVFSQIADNMVDSFTRRAAQVYR